VVKCRIVTAVLAAATAVSLGGALVVPASASSLPAPPVPVIYDGDMDIDDATTLAYLCEEDRDGRIDLRAVTVDDNGFGTPGRSAAHARAILRRCGLPTVPVSEGTGSTAHQAPAEAVQMVQTVLTGALDDAGDPSPVTGGAAELIDHTLAASATPVVVLATGPLSNLATALGACRQVEGDCPADRIRSLYVMGGAVTVPGNLFGSALDGYDGSQEFNMWLDPVSARTVFQTVARGTTHLVPLDATNSVPITPAFVERLGADQDTPSARLVHDIVTQPGMADGIAAGFYYWWDALAAVSAIRADAGVTRWRQERIDVVLDGAQSGRTVVSADGSCQHVATEADQTLFEQTYLDALNGQ
jgi:purine nucleosidase